MSCAVGGVAGTADRGLAELPRMTAEPSLVYETFGCPAEWQAPVLEIIYRLNSSFRKNRRSLLVDQIIPSLDRIKGVPFGIVLFHISQSRSDSTLRGTCVAAHGVQFRKNRSPATPAAGDLAGLQCGVEPGPPRTHDDDIKRVCQRSLSSPSNIRKNIMKILTKSKSAPFKKPAVLNLNEFWFFFCYVY